MSLFSFGSDSFVPPDYTFLGGADPALAGSFTYNGIPSVLGTGVTTSPGQGSDVPWWATVADTGQNILKDILGYKLQTQQIKAGQYPGQTGPFGTGGVGGGFGGSGLSSNLFNILILVVVLAAGFMLVKAALR